jgi:hypothetical protein
VMSAAQYKENNRIVKKVGSGSTWGARERTRFKVKLGSKEVEARGLIGEEWFELGDDETQRKGIISNNRP